MIGGEATHNSKPRYPTRTRVTTPYPASAGGRRGRTLRNSRRPEIHRVLLGRPPVQGAMPPRRALRPNRRRPCSGIPRSGRGVAAPIIGRDRASRLPGVRCSNGAPVRRRHWGPRRQPLAVPLKAGGHLVLDGVWGGVDQELLGRGITGGREVSQYGPRPSGNSRPVVHQGGHYRLFMGRPKRPRRTWVGGRQGVCEPRGDVPPAEALPRPQGRVVRDPRRGKHRTARSPHGCRPRRGGPPDSAPTSREALDSTSGALTLVGGTFPRGTLTQIGRGRCRRYPRSIEVVKVTQALTEAFAPGHQAFFAVDKRPRCLALLPANSASEAGPGSLPVQRLVEVQKLAEVRMRVQARPLGHVGEAEPHQAAHHCDWQMPKVSLSTCESYHTPATSSTHWVARMAAAGVDSPRRSAVPRKATMRGIRAGNPKGTSRADHQDAVWT